MSYIVITSEMISELGLKGNELIIYAIINGFCQDGTTRFKGSLSYLMNFTSLSKQGVINILNNLESKGIIDKQEAHICSTKMVSYGVVKKVDQGSNNLTSEGGQKTLPGVKKVDLINKDSIDNNINKKRNVRKKEMELPYDDPRIKELWVKVLENPDWQRKTPYAIECRLKTLKRIGGDDVEKAIASMEQTINKAYLDFYEPRGYTPKSTPQKPLESPKKTPWERLGWTKEQWEADEKMRKLVAKK